MNVRCPDCLTVYRLDPAKVTERVRARCARCAGILTIEAIDPAMVPAASRAVEPTLREEPNTIGPRFTPDPAFRSEPAPVEAPAPLAAQVPRPFAQPRATTLPDTEPRPHPAAPVFHPTPGMPVQSVRVPPPARPTESQAGATTPPSTFAAPIEIPAAIRPSPEFATRNPFLSRDPEERARRLARALVSDIIVYQPDKRRRALEDGTLAEAFKEEIAKSWKEYRLQMGDALANSTSHFTEALNEILAEGRQIF